MTYKEIIDIFKKKAQGHFFINEFGYGDISDIMTPDDNKSPYYPYVFLNPISVTGGERISRFNFNLICMTQSREDDANVIRNQSDCIDNLRDLIARVNNTLIDPLVQIDDTFTFTPFKERFQDNVVGASCNITVTYPSILDACNSPIADPAYCLVARDYNGTNAPWFNTTYKFGGWGYWKYVVDEYKSGPVDTMEWICDTRYAYYITDEVKYGPNVTDPIYPMMVYIDTGYPDSPFSYLSGYYTTFTSLGTSFECGNKQSYLTIADLVNTVSYAPTQNDNGWILPNEGWVKTFDPNDSEDRTGNVYIFKTDCTDPEPKPTSAPQPPPSNTPTPTTTPTITPTATPTLTPTISVTPTNTLTPTNTQTPTSSVTATPTITPTNTQTPTSSVTATPTITPTNTSTPTPTPSTSVPSIDPDAAAYLADVVASGGTTNPTIEKAVDTLFTSLKSARLYSKMYAMWPYVGGTAASHAINAKLNKSYDITWYGGMTHGISGSTGNSSNSYGDTGFNNNTWAQDNMSFGVYCGTNLSTGGNDQLFGYSNSAEEPAVQIAPGAGGGSVSYFRCGNSAGTSLTHGIQYRGNYIATRTGSTAGYLYRNATLFQTDSNTYTKDASGRSVYIFSIRTATGFFDPTPDTLSFTFVGDGLSTSEVSTLDNIINTFQTSLGRNTY